jgi:parallel beta-helix repeat protein
MKKQVFGVMFAAQLVFSASLAWGAQQITALPYTISSSGSYYISQSLTSTNQNNHDGIIINASNVSIDLGGNALIGNGHQGTGIGLDSQATNIRNIEITNGTVTNFGYGVNLLYVNNSYDICEGTRVINLRVVDNVPSSLSLGVGSLIKDSFFAYNGGGPGAGAGSLITGNISHHSGGNGFAGGSEAITYIGNTMYSNNGEGIYSGPGNTIINNTSYGNGSNGFWVADGSTIKNNTTYGNGQNGIYLDGGKNLVIGNTVFNNDQSSQGFANISTCSDCVINNNVQ